MCVTLPTLTMLAIKFVSVAAIVASIAFCLWYAGKTFVFIYELVEFVIKEVNQRK